MKQRHKAGVALVAALALGGAGGAATYAAFYATAENAGNGFATAASFAHMRAATGTYTGNGVDNRAIAVPFQPNVVIVKGNTAQTAVLRSSALRSGTWASISSQLRRRCSRP